MSNDNQEVSNEKPRGQSGEVGTATASKALKKLWHTSAAKVSLKAFARQLLKGTDKDKAQLVKDWYRNKAGKLNAKRSEKTIQRINLEKSATKLARKPKKSS
jgi:hypothetical protein